MIEVTGNLWTYPADIRVITTNGTVKKNGECVMGRGCAAEAKKKYPAIPAILGNYLKEFGNHVAFLYGSAEGIYSFPVKHNWYEKGDIELICRSARELVNIVDNIPTNDPTTKLRVVLPRPGCGNGGLRWEDVKPVLEPILDDRFHVITF